MQTSLFNQQNYFALSQEARLERPVSPRRGNPNFRAKWAGPTVAVRLPEQYKDAAVDYCKALEQGNQPSLPIDGQYSDRLSKLIPLADLSVDPKRFQYKLITYDSHGSTNSLLGVKAWDENLEGILLVWLDPIDGKTYVINGHNRYSKALSLGVKELPCKFIQSDNDKQARAIGALVNIAEGKGNAIDAAKFFKDSDLTESQIKQSGKLPMTQSTVKDGLALSKLESFLFDRVVAGLLSIEDGAIIGNALGPDLQAEIMPVLDKLSGKELAEYCELINAAQQETIEQVSLFGADTSIQTNAIEQAKVIAYTKARLKKDRRIFGTVARNKAALEQANNSIDKETSESIANKASHALAWFDQFKLQAGELRTLINAAANEAMDRDSYYESVLALLANPLAV